MAQLPKVSEKEVNRAIQVADQQVADLAGKSMPQSKFWSNLLGYFSVGGGVVGFGAAVWLRLR